MTHHAILRLPTPMTEYMKCSIPTLHGNENTSLRCHLEPRVLSVNYIVIHDKLITLFVFSSLLVAEPTYTFYLQWVL